MLTSEPPSFVPGYESAPLTRFFLFILCSAAAEIRFVLADSILDFAAAPDHYPTYLLPIPADCQARCAESIPHGPLIPVFILARLV